MNILAFESSAVSASVAYLRNGVIAASAYQSAGLTHSKTLLPMLESMMANSGLNLDDTDILAVAAGPGSFTGLRIGISLVKGLAFARGIPCVGVSTLEALAYNMPRSETVLCVVMDARAGQVYNANFNLAGETPVRLCEDRAVTVESLKEELAKLSGRIVIAGDGTHLLEGIYEPAPGNLRLQNAYGVARAAEIIYNKGGDFSPANLKPLYHRLPQAERERLNKLKI